MEQTSSASSSSSSSVSIGEELFFDTTSEDDSERETRICVINYAEITVANYNDANFIKHFRISHSASEDLISMFAKSEHYLKLDTSRGLPTITPCKHIYLFLWFVGHEATSYRDMADRFDLSLSSVFESISRVAEFIGDIAPEYIKWPSENEMYLTKQYFLKKEGFPNIIGCIDGTHIRIERPMESSESYYNRKDYYFSIQMQIVCDHQYKIIDFDAGYPGSVHDARVFKNSSLAMKLRTEVIKTTFFKLAEPISPDGLDRF